MGSGTEALRLQSAPAAWVPMTTILKLALHSKAPHASCALLWSARAWQEWKRVVWVKSRLPQASFSLVSGFSFAVVVVIITFVHTPELAGHTSCLEGMLSDDN